MIEIDGSIIRRIADMHAVYRMFGVDGDLLYIGVTGRSKRFGEHSEKQWFPLVDTIRLEWFPSRADASLAEIRAIASERPTYNRIGIPGEMHREARTGVHGERMTDVVAEQIGPEEALRILAASPPGVPADMRDELLALLAGEGMSARKIAEKLGGHASRFRVVEWLHMLQRDGVACLDGTGRTARWRLVSRVAAPCNGCDDGDGK